MPPLHTSSTLPVVHERKALKENSADGGSSSSVNSSGSANSAGSGAVSNIFKLKLLVVLVMQTSASILIGRYTRSSVKSQDDLYEVNHLILITEVGKLLLSVALEYASTNGQLLASLQRNVFDRPRDALKILVPALLYLFQNSLLYVALSNLTAPLFQVTNQAKLVTTALVSVVMLGRRYSVKQWFCLVGLSIGVAIVVLGERAANERAANNSLAVTTDTEEDAEVAEAAGITDATDDNAPTQNVVLGLISVSIACLSSALAGVYFEKVVKGHGNAASNNGPPVSVWMRNIQLAFFTIVLATMHGLWSSGLAIEPCFITEEGVHVKMPTKSYFHGFTPYVWLLVVLQAGGGLLVAAVIKYADNVLKGLATGVSVCLSTAVSTIVFHTPLTNEFLVGATLILSCVYTFSMAGSGGNGGGAKPKTEPHPQDQDEDSERSVGEDSNTSDPERPFLTERKSSE